MASGGLYSSIYTPTPTPTPIICVAKLFLITIVHVLKRKINDSFIHSCLIFNTLYVAQLCTVLCPFKVKSKIITVFFSRTGETGHIH